MDYVIASAVLSYFVTGVAFSILIDISDEIEVRFMTRFLWFAKIVFRFPMPLAMVVFWPWFSRGERDV